MAMPPCGTFRYVIIVPADNKRESPWRVESDEAIWRTGDKLMDSRLMGHHPTLAITGYAPALPSGRKPIQIPLARLTLKASGKRDATASAGSFWVDRRILSVLQADDRLYVTRTACAGLGISLLRQDRLVFAAGAITVVPLGKGVSTDVPAGLIEEAARPFRKLDPEFHFGESPLFFAINGTTRILFAGRETIGGYDVTVVHGARVGIPGENESAAITDSTACKHAIAALTAEVFDASELEISD